MSGAETVRRSAPLTIRSFAGYDRRDQLGGGAEGMILRFTAIEPDVFAATLRVNTGWMARPLAGPMVRGAVQERLPHPGVDAPLRDGAFPAPVVVLCVPRPADDPTQAERLAAGDVCEHLGVPCDGTTAFGASEDALRVLIEHGPDALDTWLRTFAARHLEAGDPR